MTKGRLFKMLAVNLVVTMSVAVLFNWATVSATEQPAKLIITEVQTQSASSKTEEFIEIYNPTDQEVDLSSFTLSYLSASGSTASAMTLSPSVHGTSLRARNFLLVSQSSYPIGADATFTTGLNDVGGHIQISLNGAVVDTVGWGTATHPEGQPSIVATKGATISRKLDANGIFQDTENNSADFGETTPSPRGGGLVETAVDACPNIEGVQQTLPVGYSIDQSGNCVIEPTDVCPNISDAQTEIPDGYEEDEAGNCILKQDCLVEISEISAQPNYNGQEYVEFLNSSDKTAKLNLCTVEINGGSKKTLNETLLSPGARYIQVFSSGTIRNSAGQIVLINSLNQETAYAYAATSEGQVVNYESGNQAGVVSDKPTPGASNETIVLSDEELSAAQSEGYADCGVGKYRNPETNRCRNIVIATAVLAACDAGQERNPDTNRCRKVTTAATLAACATGQERNPDTNRCRKIVVNTANTAPVTVNSATRPDDRPLRFSFAVAIGILGGVAAYGVYEYRSELRSFKKKLFARFQKTGPPG